ncbi:hypothetical protein [Rhizobium phaseoli]|uniref:hypothetical protein n=1 Tax=Rhizobium phaseoli TaxID=396 RepID=UPI003AABD598
MVLTNDNGKSSRNLRRTPPRNSERLSTTSKEPVSTRIASQSETVTFFLDSIDEPNLTRTSFIIKKAPPEGGAIEF